MSLTKDDVREIVEASEARIRADFKASEVIIRADIKGEFEKLRHELRGVLDPDFPALETDKRRSGPAGRMKMAAKPR